MTIKQTVLKLQGRLATIELMVEELEHKRDMAAEDDQWGVVADLDQEIEDLTDKHDQCCVKLNSIR